MVWKKVAVLSLVAVFAATMGFAADSRQNRSENTVMVSTTPLGLHPATLVGLAGGVPTVGGSFYLNEDIQLGGDFASFNGEQTGDDAEGTISYTSIGGYARYYWGTNSFNTLLAVHSRSWAGTVEADTTTVDEETGQEVDLTADVDINSNVVMATVGLGNQWVMDWGLVIGLDYLVVGLPLSETTSANVDATGSVGGFTESLDDQEKEDAEEAAKDLGRVLNVISYFPGLFVLSFGLSF